MHRKIGRDDLRHVVALALGGREQPDLDNQWSVCEGYVLRDDTIVPKYPLSDDVSFSDIWNDNVILTKWRRYKPLEEAPDLFIRLAHLYESDDFVEAALSFSHYYGLLGGSSFAKTVDWHRIKVSTIREEAERAWKILRMYEAVLNRDASTARTMVSENRKRSDSNEAELALQAVLLEELGERGLEQYFLHSGLELSLRMVDAIVKEHCRFQSFIPFEDAENGLFNADASTVRSVWRFKNLLGAAYLQMHWLMTSGGELSRCLHCGRIIISSRPNPESRKRRRDRKFCDSACRQAHHRKQKTSGA